MKDLPTVIDVLSDLLDLELSSLFQFLSSTSIYLDKSTAAMRKPLAEMIAASHRRAAELSKLIADLGSTQIPRASPAEELYEAYLSLKYLLPRLINEKELTIARYEAAKLSLGDRSPEANAFVQKHLSEHHAEMAILQRPIPPRSGRPEGALPSTLPL
jgi:hypothetical protein